MEVFLRPLINPILLPLRMGGWVTILATCGVVWAQSSPESLTRSESHLLQEAPAAPSSEVQTSSDFEFEGAGMEEILHLAISHSPELRVLQARVEASRMRQLAAGLLPNPEVAGGAKTQSGGGSGPILEISQEIPWNGALRLERESARLGHRAEEARAVRETQVALHRVQSQIVETLSAQAAEALEEQNLHIATDSHDLVANRFESGLVAELPLSLARAEKGAAENSARLAQREVALQRERLAALVGVAESDLPPIGGSLRTPLVRPESLPESPTRGDLRAKDFEIQSAEAEVEAARRARVPNPVLGYSREEAGSETENFFRIGLEIPLWNSGLPEVRHRAAEKEVVRTEKAQLERQADSERNLALREIEERREAVDRYEREILPAIEASLSAAADSFRSGKTDLSLLLQTQSRLIEIKREALTAKKQLRLAELDYLLAVGAPIQSNVLRETPIR